MLDKVLVTGGAGFIGSQKRRCAKPSISRDYVKCHTSSTLTGRR